MKKIITAIALFTATFTNAQNTKEGSVTYNMTFEGLPKEQADMMGEMESKVTFKGEKSLYEVNSMMYNMKALGDEKGVLMVMEQMGNKLFVRMSKEEIDKEKVKEKTPDPKIEYINETKTLAGYACKKAIVTNTSKEGDVKTEVWYCEKIPNITGGKSGAKGEMFKGLKGMPLEYSVPQGAMKIKVSAKEVSFGTVPDSKFVVSTEGYKEIKMDDYKKMQGGGK